VLLFVVSFEFLATFETISCLRILKSIDLGLQRQIFAYLLSLIMIFVLFQVNYRSTQFIIYLLIAGTV